MIEQKNPLELIQDARLPAGLGGRSYGVYPALVTNIVDPDGQGRVQVKLTWAVDSVDGEYLAWARLATLMGGNNRGSWFIPEVDDEVLVCFEAGDARRPYVIGALWNGKDTPPETMDSEGKNNPKVLRSRNGIKITLDDTDGQETLTLETPKGQKMTMKDEPSSITLQTMGGQKVTMQDEPTSITIATQVGQKVTLMAEPSTVTLETPLGQKVTLMDEPPSLTLSNSLGCSIMLGETGITLSAFGNTIAIDEAGITIASPELLSIDASLTEITSGTVTVEAGLSEFVGVVNTPSLIAESIVSPSYTPGAGNILGL